MVEGHASDDPLSFESLLRGVLVLLREHPVQLLVPFMLLGALFGGMSPDAVLVDFGDSPWLLAPLFAFAGLVALAVVLIMLLAFGALFLVGTRAALMAVDGREPDLAAALHEVRPKLATGIVAFVVFTLVAALGFALFLVPGVFLLGVLAPWLTVHLVEDVSGFAAFRRAWELSEGRRVELFLLSLGGVGASLFATLFLGWWPFIGDLLVGAANGALMSVYVALGAIYYTRRTAPIVPAEPASGEANG